MSEGAYSPSAFVTQSSRFLVSLYDTITLIGTDSSDHTDSPSVGKNHAAGLSQASKFIAFSIIHFSARTDSALSASKPEPIATIIRLIHLSFCRYCSPIRH
jgi:hypothetical protein